MKTIILNEGQLNLLKEAMNNEFSFETLKSLPTFMQRLMYCKKNLGQSIGGGSSRIVFQLNDQWCLKLAKNEKGIAQNYTEDDGYMQKMELFTNIDDDRSDTENYTFITSEYAIPAKEEDFMQVLGVSFDYVCDFIDKAASIYIRNTDGRIVDLRDNEYCSRLDDYGFFYELEDYIVNYRLPIGDLKRISSWGMVKRYDQVYMVLLDSGLNQQVGKKYYNF